jgi:hypothetical protein
VNEFVKSLSFEQPCEGKHDSNPERESDAARSHEMSDLRHMQMCVIFKQGGRHNALRVATENENRGGVTNFLLMSPKNCPHSAAVFLKDGNDLKLIAEIPRARISSVVREIRACGVPGPHRNSKPVNIVAVDRNAAKKWPQIKYEQLQPGSIFESATAASHFLDFDQNEVGMRLAAAHRKARRRGTLELFPSVIIRGVTLRYRDVQESQSVTAASSCSSTSVNN